MTSSIISDDGYKATRIFVFIFVLFAVFSFLYSITTGNFNGDFIDHEVTLSKLLLFVNLVLTIIPYWLLWITYKFFKKKDVYHQITIPMKGFEFFVLTLLIINIITTIFFGVGKAASEVYEAPAVIKPFIQVLNRIDIGYISFLFILISKNKIAIYRTLILLILISALKASIGVFLSIFLVFGLKNYSDIKEYFKTKKTIVLLIILVTPIFIQTIYEIRDQMRYQNNDKQELKASKLIFGKLIGRLSSFSNSAFIIQEAVFFAVQSKSLDNFYFQKQALGGVFGANFLPVETPELLMIGTQGNTSRTVSFMTGTQGNLIISIFKSFKEFIVNIFTIFLMVFSTFSLIRLLRLNYANEYAVILLIYPITSGVGNEYAMVLFSVIFLVAFFLVVNTLHRKHNLNLN